MTDQNETIKLLKECDAGTRMAVESLSYVIHDLSDGKLRMRLEESKKAHDKIQGEIEKYLSEYQESGKDPAMIASMMSRMKETMKMATEEQECAAANYIIDGCNMGIKSIYKYFNQYPHADKKIKQLVDEIVQEEERLCRDLRCYL